MDNHDQKNPPRNEFIRNRIHIRRHQYQPEIRNLHEFIPRNHHQNRFGRHGDVYDRPAKHHAPHRHPRSRGRPVLRGYPIDGRNRGLRPHRRRNQMDGKSALPDCPDRQIELQMTKILKNL